MRVHIFERSRIRGGTMRSCIVVALTTGLLAVFSPTGMMAQEDHTIEVTPFIGGALNLGQVSEPFVDDEGLENQTAVDDALAFGFRLGLALAPRLTVEVTSAAVPTSVSVSDGNFFVGFKTDIYMLNLGVAYGLGDPGSDLRPFVVAGGGVKRYSGSFETETDPSVDIGGGLRLRMGGSTDLRVEIRDHMSSFEAVPEGEDAQFQHDILLTMGVSFGLF